METGSEFDLSVDIKCIKSTVEDYVAKHKIGNGIHIDNDTLSSRIGFIAFQFRNIFF